MAELVEGTSLLTRQGFTPLGGSNPLVSAQYLDMPKELKIGRYKHYKGNLYEVVGLATHSETKDRLVVYRALYDSPEFGKNALWVRPLAMFLETIEIDGQEVPRFAYIEE